MFRVNSTLSARNQGYFLKVAEIGRMDGVCTVSEKRSEI